MTRRGFLGTLGALVGGLLVRKRKQPLAPNQWQGAVVTPEFNRQVRLQLAKLELDAANNWTPCHVPVAGEDVIVCLKGGMKYNRV